MSTDKQILSALEKLVYDPLGFVHFAYPWGEPGILEHEDGPDEWQSQKLREIGAAMQGSTDPVNFAVRSGHGIGKTTWLAWVHHWFISTRPHPQIVVTANTKVQLEAKTWRELAKWHNMSIHKHWFQYTATKFYFKQFKDTWFSAAIPWSKERSEAFAGTHEKHVLLIFDEASLIDDVIWEVAEGAMTTPGSLWVVAGNPTRNTGRFSECWKKYKHRWLRSEIDSRTAKMADKKKLQQWIDDYGEDSDFVRVRVKGQEPRTGSMQLIGDELASLAQKRVIPPHVYHHAPKVLSIDVARFGDDQTVFLKRQGLASHDLQKFRGLDTMATASHAARVINEFEPDAVFIDEVGIGAGVVDRLRQLHYDVIGVNGQRTATDETKYSNKRTEMWCLMKDWLDSGGSIPEDRDLKEHLCAPEYGYDGKGRRQLERKEDLKDRLGESPDCGDALAMSFAEPVYLKNVGVNRRQNFSQYEYDCLSYG